jgi:rhodanese-related sulfurtransferase
MKRLWVFFLGLLAAQAVFAARLAGVTPDELADLVAKGATVVDIRTPAEWKATGLIPGSHKLTFFDAEGQYDQARWLGQLKSELKDPASPVVLVCRSGHRSATVGKILANEPGFAQVYHLEKGIRGWIGESRAVSPACSGTSC